MTDPYVDGVYRWWHLSVPPSELTEAEAAGWLGETGAAIDIGCGLGTEIAALPFPAGVFDVALDRGCFHYLSPVRWPDCAAEAWRVLRPGGRLLLRACLTSQGVRNEVTEPGITGAFADQGIERLERSALRSDTRTMQALVVWLRRAQ